MKKKNEKRPKLNDAVCNFKNIFLIISYLGIITALLPRLKMLRVGPLVYCLKSFFTHFLIDIEIVLTPLALIGFGVCPPNR